MSVHYKATATANYMTNFGIFFFGQGLIFTVLYASTIFSTSLLENSPSHIERIIIMALASAFYFIAAVTWKEK